ncbi:MAG TPA: hypothetical protein PLN48_16855 [Lachnospiraceae bacterium]|nr:hypothetical protein [Lachnospiraceae bacterium]
MTKERVLFILRNSEELRRQNQKERIKIETSLNRLEANQREIIYSLSAAGKPFDVPYVSNHYADDSKVIAIMEESKKQIERKRKELLQSIKELQHQENEIHCILLGWSRLPEKEYTLLLKTCTNNRTSRLQNK